MRTRFLGKVLSFGIAALFVGVAAPASAKTTKAKTEGRVQLKHAALTASDQEVKLFGTSFCVPSSVPGSGCDVALPEGAMAVATPRAERPPRIDVLGVSLCSQAEETGPNCDVAWQYPQPPQPGRDAPEIRTNDVMPRRR